MSIFKKKSSYIILLLVLVIAGYSIYVRIANERYEVLEKASEDHRRILLNSCSKDQYEVLFGYHSIDQVTIARG